MRGTLYCYNNIKAGRASEGLRMVARVCRVQEALAYRSSGSSALGHRASARVKKKKRRTMVHSPNSPTSETEELEN